MEAGEKLRFKRQRNEIIISVSAVSIVVLALLIGIINLANTEANVKINPTHVTVIYATEKTSWLGIYDQKYIFQFDNGTTFTDGGCFPTYTIGQSVELHFIESIPLEGICN